MLMPNLRSQKQVPVSRQVSMPDHEAEFFPDAAETDAMADAEVADAGADAVGQVLISD